MSRLEFFLQTITFDILDVKDFVDWNKIENKTNILRKEIALLQSVKYSENPASDLRELLLQEPGILDVLQLLIAHTPEEIWFADGRFVKFKEDKNVLKAKVDRRAREISGIFLDVGLLSFLRNVESVRDCVKGVLIGLEPNVRKNRRGRKFEAQVSDLVEDVSKQVGDELSLHLIVKHSLKVDLQKESKTVDFGIIVEGEKKPRAVIEVNFYFSTGSKPSETLPRAYPEVQRELEEKGIRLIVLTDGKGWLEMRGAINTMLDKLTYCYNIKQAREGKLREALLTILRGR